MPSRSIYFSSTPKQRLIAAKAEQAASLAAKANKKAAIANKNAAKALMKLARG
jgi:hypothetical protein